MYCDTTPVVVKGDYTNSTLPQNLTLSTATNSEVRIDGISYKLIGTDLRSVPNGIKDEQNNSLIYDPSYAWIIPAGANSKPAYIAIEGATLTKEVENDDWSRDIQVYKKVGVGVMLTNDICVYRNTALTADLSKAHG